MPRPAGERVADNRSCEEAKKKGPRKLRGPFRHFDFRDSDLMRSSSFKNSAVSSAIVLGGGLGGKGITSDIGRTSRDASPRGGSFLPCNWRVCAAKYSSKRARRVTQRSPPERSVVSWRRP